jgi:hypothetical protein
LSRRVRSLSILSVCNATLKLALVALLAFAVARQDLPQFHGKSMTGRAIGYPVAALLVPVVWWIVSRRRAVRYPVVVDMLVVAPFVIDMAGNAANLYDIISWWDDVNHLVTRAGSAGGKATGARRETAPPSAPPGRSSSRISVTFIRNSPELRTTYHDTLGDLALGLSGSVVAAALVARSGRRPG